MLRTWIWFSLGQLGVAFTPFGNSWCGKPYESNLSPMDPGGQTPAPSYSTTPLLQLSIQPRYSLYLASETSASFVVDAPLSHSYGEAYRGPTDSTAKIDLTISIDGAGKTLATGAVAVNSRSNELPFTLSKLKAQTDSYNITVKATTSGGAQTYQASTQLYFLPNPDSGSVTKVDYLNQGLLVSSYPDVTSFTRLFPYGWYSDSSVTSDPDNANAYLAAGYNFIHLVPDESKPTMPFAEPAFDQFLSRMDEIGLYIVYDMRGTYMNLSLVASQVSTIKSHKSLLMWYTADEPDGWSYPLNSTQLASSTIKSIDPYHPVSLVLNCIDFYYEDYSLGADVILQDAYPVGINATFSTQFGTPCTWDYGDCGCDGCIGSVTDVSERIDILRSYQEYYNQAYKPLWAVPQAFGNQTYWDRYPTPQEEIVMQQLAMNHGAMGISMWIYPSATDLQDVTSQYATAMGFTNTKTHVNNTASTILLNSLPTISLPVSGSDASTSYDVSSWDVNGQLLVGIVNFSPDAPQSNETLSNPSGKPPSRRAKRQTPTTITITLPRSLTSTPSGPLSPSAAIWGSSSSYSLSDGNKLTKTVSSSDSMTVDVLILE